jgi:uncharacterized coiled-coil protein SlyX
MNLTIETDLKEILIRLESKIDNNHKETTDRLTKLEIGVTELKGEIKTLDERLSGQIATLDERLSGQIATLDGRLSGQIATLDTKVDNVSKRLDNQEFLARGVSIGIFVAFIGGFLKLFGLIPN